MGVEVVVHGENNMRSRILALMSYLGVLVFVPLVVNRDDEYVHFHARQGLVIWTFGVLAIFMLYVPGLGKLVFSFLAMAVMAFSMIGLVSVLLHKDWKLPIVYGLASKL
jgi:fumarate reductase subunit D